MSSPQLASPLNDETAEDKAARKRAVTKQRQRKKLRDKAAARRLLETSAERVTRLAKQALSQRECQQRRKDAKRAKKQHHESNEVLRLVV